MLTARAFAILLACVTTSAQATVISGTLTGTQNEQGYNAGDPLGLFGTPGSVQPGDPITVYYSYNSADFSGGTANNCGTSTCMGYNSTNASPLTFFSITLNGKTQTYYPQGNNAAHIVFQQLAFGSYLASYFSESFSNSDGSIENIRIGTSQMGLFGQSLDSIISYPTTSEIYITSTSGKYGLGQGYDEFAFNAMASASTPEPNTLVLSITGALCLLQYGIRKGVGSRKAM